MEKLHRYTYVIYSGATTSKLFNQSAPQMTRIITRRGYDCNVFNAERLHSQTIAAFAYSEFQSMNMPQPVESGSDPGMRAVYTCKI